MSYLPRLPFDSLAQAIYLRVVSTGIKFYVMGVPGQNESMPYAGIAQVTATEDSDKEEGRWVINCMVEVYTQGMGTLAGTTIMNQIIAALTPHLSLGDNFIQECDVDVGSNPSMALEYMDGVGFFQLGTLPLQFRIRDQTIGL